ncbi:uncharacterized protein METZ01_LOCUS249315, partial [marine metagenome]
VYHLIGFILGEHCSVLCHSWNMVIWKDLKKRSN